MKLKQDKENLMAARSTRGGPSTHDYVGETVRRETRSAVRRRITKTQITAHEDEDVVIIARENL